MRIVRATNLFLFLVLSAGLRAQAQEPSSNARSNSNPPPRAAAAGAERTGRVDRTEPSDAAREAAAVEFVRANHPELADLLEQLKAMKPDQYERAIRELWQVSRTLAAYKKNEIRRYQPALDLWRARSRAELLAAQQVESPSKERENQLRAAITKQIDAEIHQQEVERELGRERLKKLDESIERLKSRRDKAVESRYQALVKKGQRARRQEVGQSAASPSATEKGENEE
jgi:hypothetical protein